MPMQSRTDQVHSYQFFLQRVVSGLVAKESDPAELPFRRLGWAGFGSVMVAVLVAAGFGVYGLLVGGGATSWREGDSVIVEKGTDVTYIYRDDRLHPMANVVSARLALGGNAEVARVSARSLAGVPRGATLGIPGAPAGLPGNGNLLTGGWTYCSTQRPDGRGGEETVSVLAVGRGAERGQPVGDQAVLVGDADDPDAAPQLVWRGHRFALTDVDSTLRALGAGRERALPVRAAWLDALPVGDPLRAPEVTDLGDPTDLLGDPDIHIGQVVEDAGNHYLVRRVELVALTPLQSRIVLNDRATGDAYPSGDPEVVALPPGALAGVAIEPLPERTTTSPPEHPPEFAAFPPEDLRDAAVCAEFAPGGFTPQVRAGGRLPAADAIATPGLTEPGHLLADYVLVGGGSAALVQSVASPEAAGGSWHIVTDQGIRYPLPVPEVAGTLGFELERRVRIPAGLLALLPAGPALDPAAAILPVAPAGG